jgi:hypothetical protein
MMMNRIASLLSSLAVVVLALTLTATFWRARVVDVLGGETHEKTL